MLCIAPRKKVGIELKRVFKKSKYSLSTSYPHFLRTVEAAYLYESQP